MSLVEKDERTTAVENAGYAWGYKVLAYALLLDVMYRSFRFQETPWDMFAVIVLAGLVVTGYQLKEKTLSRTWAATAVWAAAVAAIFAVAIGLLLTNGGILR